MQRGLVRYHHTGNFHFITFSCFHRLPHLGKAAARDLFEDAFERTRRGYRFVVAGYVVMPEHVHLLLGEPLKGTVSGMIHALKLSVGGVAHPYLAEEFWVPVDDQQVVPGSARLIRGF